MSAAHETFRVLKLSQKLFFERKMTLFYPLGIEYSAHL